MDKARHENYLLKVERVQELTRHYYQPGRIDRCYAEVWRRWIYPTYPMCYETYRSYMKVDVVAERAKMRAAVDKPTYQERTLFDLIAC